MRHESLLTLIILTAPAFGQTTIINEDFSNGLPSNYVVQVNNGPGFPNGTVSVAGGVLTLDSACVQLPGTFSRTSGLSIEADVNIKDGGIGDFNIWGLYDTLPSCTWGFPNGYGLGWYPAGSDNPTDLITLRTSSTSTDIATRPVQIIANQWYHIKAEFLADGTIITYINGVKTMTASDSTFITGSIALRSYQGVDIDNLRVTTLSGAIGPRTFVVSFTGAGNRPPTCNVFGTPSGCWMYPDNFLNPGGSQGMTALIANIRSNVSLSNVVSKAFTYFTYPQTNPNVVPDKNTDGSTRDHVEAESWLFDTEHFNTKLDRLIIIGHSYGGNRARLFANQIMHNHGVVAQDLVLVDPIDWDFCTITDVLSCEKLHVMTGECLQSNDGLDRPHVTPSERTRVYYETTDRCLNGYKLPGVTSQKLSLMHEEIEGAEIVHRQTINDIMPVFSAPPPFAVDLNISNRAAYLSAEGLVVVPLFIKNVGAFLADDMKVVASNSRLVALDGSTIIESTPLLFGTALPAYLCSSSIAEPTLRYTCPDGTGASIELRFPKPASWDKNPAPKFLAKFTLVSNGVYFVRSLRVK